MVQTQVVRSAGGVIGREVGGQLEVALIATHGKTRWALPKGLVARGEKPEEAARREIQEETGLSGRLLCKLGTVDYWYYPEPGLRHHKFVNFYLFEYLSGEPAPQLAEVDAAEWVPIDEAIQRASYDSERDILVKAHAAWRDLYKPEQR